MIASPRQGGSAKSFVMSMALFVVLIVAYGVVSHIRHEANPNDKIVPSVEQLVNGIQQSITPDHSGEIPLVVDTVASLYRFTIGLLLTGLISAVVAISMAVFRPLHLLLHRFLLYFGKIPPLALLPILFIAAGVGDTTKILLIVLGVAPTVTLDMYSRIQSLPAEHFVKAATLGASKWVTTRKVIIPQIMPWVIHTLRLNLLNIWVFLIAAESIAANAGLGYRIFVVRRYLAMDIIIPYVLWIALLSFTIDALLKQWIAYRYKWFAAQ